jgi:hypothetical protein
MLDRYTNGPSVTPNYYPHRPYSLQVETNGFLLSLKEGGKMARKGPSLRKALNETKRLIVRRFEFEEALRMSADRAL